MSLNNIDLNEYLKFILNCLFVIFIILFIYGDFLISFVLGENYVESYLYLILGIIAESLRVFINSLFVVYYLKKNTKSIFYYHFFIAILFFILLFIFRESMNVFIIISSLSFSLLISITHFLFINNNLKLSLNIKFLIVISIVFTLIYLSSLMGSFFFNFSKYCFSSLLVIFLIKKIYNYLEKLLLIKTSK